MIMKAQTCSELKERFTQLNTLLSFEKKKQKTFIEAIDSWRNSGESESVKTEKINSLSSHFDRSVLLVVEYQEEIKLITEELIRRKVWKTIKLNK